MIQWYAIRATGVVVLILFTATVVLGLLNRSRLTSDGWPRFLIDRLHRNISLLSLVFLCIHIITAATDAFVSIDFADAVIPFAHSYSPFWVGLGAVAFDLLIAVIVTSLLRGRVGLRNWRRVHWLAYLAWPLAVAHGIGLGTDSGSVWLIGIQVGCIAATLAALVMRLAAPAQTVQEAWS